MRGPPSGSPRISVFAADLMPTAGRMSDSFSGDWRFGRGMDVEANAASTWTRVSAADTGVEIHWATHGVTATGDTHGRTESISVRTVLENET